MSEEQWLRTPQAAIACGVSERTLKRLRGEVLEEGIHFQAGFSSNSGRFKSSNTITPGPGSYNDARPGLTLIKRSFNVTLASEN